ncbi:hypothetical protein EU527_04730 [Candidatus Thorarchaeota archaeon]|nr:MAG: hypothetical protein EU527_04730 [Candidatus Thorarchaeota archaeon]
MFPISKSSREIPKTIAAFGEKQFKDTGAKSVEVLRVKAAVIRKYFQQLKGILFLVAVISLDRVRVYFFNAAGVMVIGENLEQSTYDVIRKSSKLVVKFEKPKPLTPEEIRIEATQELRDALGKAIRKVSRFIAAKEPSFPDIFVTQFKFPEHSQSFGLQINDDNEFIFEEKALSQKWVEGLLLRTAYLVHLNKTSRVSQAACSIGNAIGLSLLKEPIQQSWLQEWRKNSKETEWAPVVNHFVRHHSTYSPESYSWMKTILNDITNDLDYYGWKEALSIVHDSLVVPLRTEDFHVIDGFCKTLSNPRQLEKRRYTLNSIHLAPRVLCDLSPIGMPLTLAITDTLNHESWAQVHYLIGKKQRYLEISTSGTEKITSIEYWLNIEDIYPSSGGPISHGQNIIRRALEKIGIITLVDGTYETTLSINDDRSIDTKERAVLERLSLGKLEILSNTLVGSPMILNTLIQKGCIALLPEFYHLGIEQELLLHGPYDVLHTLVRGSLEATLFRVHDKAYAVVSSPSSWRKPLLSLMIDSNVELYPIISVQSARGILRNEVAFSNSDNLIQWSNNLS